MHCMCLYLRKCLIAHIHCIYMYMKNSDKICLTLKWVKICRPQCWFEWSIYCLSVHPVMKLISCNGWIFWIPSYSSKKLHVVHAQLTYTCRSAAVQISSFLKMCFLVMCISMLYMPGTYSVTWPPKVTHIDLLISLLWCSALVSLLPIRKLP